MVYDSESDIVFMHGGEGKGTETWAYDYNANNWTQISSYSAPDRFLHSMAYDSQSDRIIVYGGFPPQGIVSINKIVYAYDYNSNTWSIMPAKYINCSSIIPCPTPTDPTNLSYSPFLLSLSIFAIIIIRRKKRLY
jgi:hypothetical protein